MNDTHIIEEIVLNYRRQDLDAWKAGDKSRWISGDVPAEVMNQPSYHFGEYYTLHAFQAAQWEGFVHYALGEWEPTNEKYRVGRDVVADRFPADKLNEFRRAQAASSSSPGAGEPDIFVYMEDGRNLFLEVKKENDRVSSAQLECMAQIKGILEADVGVVYLAEYDQPYTPKKYVLDLTGFAGRKASLVA